MGGSGRDAKKERRGPCAQFGPKIQQEFTASVVNALPVTVAEEAASPPARCSGTSSRRKGNRQKGDEAGRPVARTSGDPFLTADSTGAATGARAARVDYLVLQRRAVCHDRGS